MRNLRRTKPLVISALKAIDPIVDRLPHRDVVMSEIPLSIVVPLHEKDHEIARYVIRSARANVRHPIADVAVVSAPSREAIQLCRELKCRFVDETTVLDCSISHLRAELANNGYLRWQWVFQQLLKLSAPNYIETEALLVIDADTLLLKPRHFLRHGVLHQQFSHERNPAYFATAERLLGLRSRTQVSRVCHHMFAERSILQRMHADIERHTGLHWIEAILDNADPRHWTDSGLPTTPPNFFSEFETYGLYSRSFYDRIRRRYMFNYGAEEFVRGSDVDNFVDQLPHIFKSASFHSYFEYWRTDDENAKDFHQT